MQTHRDTTADKWVTLTQVDFLNRVTLTQTPSFEWARYPNAVNVTQLNWVTLTLLAKR